MTATEMQLRENERMTQIQRRGASALQKLRDNCVQDMHAFIAEVGAVHLFELKSAWTEKHNTDQIKFYVRLKFVPACYVVEFEIVLDKWLISRGPTMDRHMLDLIDRVKRDIACISNYWKASPRLTVELFSNGILTVDTIGFIEIERSPQCYHIPNLSTPSDTVSMDIDGGETALKFHGHKMTVPAKLNQGEVAKIMMFMHAVETKRRK